MRPTQIIDSHIHCGIQRSHLPIDDIRPLLREAGITAACMFAPVEDIRRTLTPQLQVLEEETALLLIDLGNMQHRLGGSALAQAYGTVGEHAPDVSPQDLRAFLEAMQQLKAAGYILAYHDRGDGALPDREHGRGDERGRRDGAQRHPES